MCRIRMLGLFCVLCHYKGKGTKDPKLSGQGIVVIVCSVILCIGRGRNCRAENLDPDDDEI
jgi:hypothetical protein